MASLALALLLQADAAGIDFFEKKIRPVLVERCYSCHSRDAEKLRGDLHLDSRPAAMKGGQLGPALVPGDPERSLLVLAIRWNDDELQMPPRRRLPPQVVADFEAWVRMGAPGAPDWAGPAEAGAPAARPRTGMSVEEGRSFWAYRLPVRPAVPAVGDASWPRGDIDRFLLARLEAEGLRPAAPAEKPVLLRRLYYDLVGLPPSPEEVDAFLADPAPDAYEKVVDRLLASPQFGERWGRRWLDVARFAESLTLRGFIVKEAWRYRDYVIDAFNADLPFDAFVREQVAGDLLESGSLEERRRRLVAATFLTIGNTNLEEQDKKQLEMDVVDEQLDTIGQAFLAQTIGCARCHDHKFDPIPTRDYYALAGILKNSRMLEHDNVSRWIEGPLPMEPEREEEARRHGAAVAALQARIKEEKALAAAARERAGKSVGVLPVASLPGVAVDDAFAQKIGEWKPSTYTGTYVGAGYIHDLDAGKGEKSVIFHPELVPGRYEVRFAYSPGANRAANVPVTILSAEGEKTLLVNQRETPSIDGRFLSLGQYRFENNQGYVIVSNEETAGYVTADAVVFIPLEELQAVRAAASGGDRVKELEAELKRLQENAPRRDRVMALREEKEIRDIPIHHRGSVHTLGETVPRGVLQVALYGDPPSMPADRSGRRELADWLADRRNPLTARVFVNRAWHWLFGAGIVRTTDNFGTTGERPSHPELLDHLAVEFMEDGWSVKRLVRRIVTASAYRMSVSGAASEADPENRLLARMNRRRLDAECIRDTVLAVSGRLRPDRPEGPTYPAKLAADYGYRHAEPRRSVYVPVFRNALPDVFEAFDFANTSVVTGRRDASTVSPQALFFMNSPFVLEEAGHAARRLLAERHADDGARIERAWRLALGRPPAEAERAVARRLLAEEPDAARAWAALFHALFASAEFRYVE